MSIALAVSDDELRRIVQGVLGTRQVSDEIRVYLIRPAFGSQPIGRSTIEHLAQRRSLEASQHVQHARLSIGCARGIEMTPAGTFVLCAVSVRSAIGREAVGWNTPRPVPESIAQGLSRGSDFFQSVRSYRQQWERVDTVSRAELDELLTCEQSLAEALQAALNALEQ